MFRIQLSLKSLPRFNLNKNVWKAKVEKQMISEMFLLEEALRDIVVKQNVI